MKKEISIEEYYAKIEFKEDYTTTDSVIFKKGSIIEDVHVVVTVRDLSINDNDLKVILEDRGYYVYDYQPDFNVGDISDQELIDELRERKCENLDLVLDIDSEDLAWYLNVGKYDEFLIILERSCPEHFGGLGKLKLSK
jgi:hypothetical protein